MRLSEDRIGAIAYKIAFELVKKRYVVSKKKLMQVTAWVEKPILDDLAREETIDEEVRQVLQSMTKCPPEGSFEYQALFQRKKEEIARRRSYSI
jgi:hypothetical protein